MGSSSLTRDVTQDPSIGNAESQPPDPQGSPKKPMFSNMVPFHLQTEKHGLLTQPLFLVRERVQENHD